MSKKSISAKIPPARQLIRIGKFTNTPVKNSTMIRNIHGLKIKIATNTAMIFRSAETRLCSTSENFTSAKIPPVPQLIRKHAHENLERRAASLKYVRKFYLR